MRGGGRRRATLLALLLAALAGIALLASWVLSSDMGPSDTPLVDLEASIPAPPADAVPAVADAVTAPVSAPAIGGPAAAAVADSRLAASAPRPSDEGRPRKTAITGRVVDTLNGKPIAGAKVTAVSYSGVGIPPLEFEIRTDAEGRFRVEGASLRGGISLRVEARGFVSESKSVWSRTEAANETTFALSPSSHLFGRVTDPEGGPVAGALVFVDREQGPDRDEWNPEDSLSPFRTFRGYRDRSERLRRWERYSASAVTGSDGRFEAKGMPVERSLTVSAAAEGFSPSEPRRDFVIPRGSAGESVELVLRPDTTLVLRIAVPERMDPPGEVAAAVATPVAPRPLVREADGTWVVRGLAGGRTWYIVEAPPYAMEFRSVEVEPGGRTVVDVLLGAGDGLSGQVVDASGRGVEGLRVGVRSTVKGAPRVDLDTGGVTDAAGRFAVRGLAEGEYRVIVEDRATLLEINQGVHRAPSTGLLLSGPGALRFRLVPPPGGSLPEADALAVSHSQEGDKYLHVAWPPRNAAYDRETGVVEVRRTYPGKTTLAVKVPDFVEVRRTLAVASGGTTDFGDIILVPSLRLRGRVRDGDGKPVPHAAVTAWYPNGVFSPASTDLEGAFELRDLAPGEVTVEVVDAGNDGKRFALATWKQVIQAGIPPLDFTLAAGGAVRVRVLDATGNPVTVAHVACEPEGKWYRPVPRSLDPDEAPGEFVGRRPAGIRIVQVLDPEMPDQKGILASATVEIRDDQEAFVEIRLKK